MSGGLRTFVIHLARAEARRPLVERLLAEAPFPGEVLEAVDGTAVSPWPIAPRYRPAYPFALGPGEVGCFLSHRAAWARIVGLGLEAALILEDDVALEPGFAEVARFAAESVAEAGYIQFQTRPFAGRARTLASRDGLAILRPELTPLRTSAQLVHRTAAERLLAASEKFDRPVDAFLQMHWETGVRVHLAQPSRVRDAAAEAGGSTISGKRRRGLLEELGRSWKRARYRAAVARLSRAHFEG